jgi:predicted dithiol-disulfide oxidoreductase (DUF899 family)
LLIHYQVASPTDYLNARLSLLEKEKSAVRLKDEITKQRQTLPLIEITKPYTFIDSETNNPHTITDLFENRPQLIIYHAMFDPSWDDACPSCTLLLDHIPPLDHLYSRSTSYAVISRATPEQIKAYKTKLGFDRFKWLSSNENDFNYDYHVTVDHDKNDLYNFRTSTENKERGMPWFASGENPGHSVFVRGGPVEKGGVGKGEEGKVYHSYSSYARGGEAMLGTLQLLDITPLGRQDGKLEGATGLGFRRRGEYKNGELGK